MRFHGGRHECYCQSPPYYQEVDDLLRHAVAQLDAGRPVGPLIKNAQFWRAAGPRNGYDVDAVDWFLYQIRLLPDHSELTGIGTDPWHDLEVTQLTRSEVSGPAEHPTGRAWLAPEKQFAEKCADAWRDFGQAPGTHLRWGRAALRIYELRTPEAQTIASLRDDFLFRAVGTGGRSRASTGGRSFTLTKIRPGRSSLPGVAEIVARSERDFDGHFAKNPPNWRCPFIPEGAGRCQAGFRPAVSRPQGVCRAC